MKKILLVILALGLAWHYYLDDSQRQHFMSYLQPNKLNEVISTPSGEQRFSCDKRRFCNEMTSFAEAQFFLQQCGAVELDENENGIPCEADPRFFDDLLKL